MSIGSQFGTGKESNWHGKCVKKAKPLILIKAEVLWKGGPRHKKDFRILFCKNGFIFPETNSKAAKKEKKVEREVNLTPYKE
jgi:hypothetical protein